jgi:hypothetical protein
MSFMTQGQPARHYATRGASLAARLILLALAIAVLITLLVPRPGGAAAPTETEPLRIVDDSLHDL